MSRIVLGGRRWNKWHYLLKIKEHTQIYSLVSSLPHSPFLLPQAVARRIPSVIIIINIFYMNVPNCVSSNSKHINITLDYFFLFLFNLKVNEYIFITSESDMSYQDWWICNGVINSQNLQDWSVVMTLDIVMYKPNTYGQLGA